MLTRLDAMAVGLAAWRLGAGRARKEDPVQAGAGVVWHARPGDDVREGEPLFTLLTDDDERFERALDALAGGYDVATQRRTSRRRWCSTACPEPARAAVVLAAVAVGVETVPRSDLLNQRVGPLNR